LRRIKSLAKEVGIPAKLSELGVTEVDLNKLADNALKDACAPGNPFMPTKKKRLRCLKRFYRIKIKRCSLRSTA
jgi:alcohol dehydrogenase